MAGSNDHIQADILYGINPDLKAHENTMRQLYNAKGLYSRADIEDAKYNRFSRFCFLLNLIYIYVNQDPMVLK